MILKEPQLEKNNDGAYCIDIIEEELDVRQCRLDNDGWVNLNTEKYSYLNLCEENIIKLLPLIQASEEL